MRSTAIAAQAALCLALVFTTSILILTERVRAQTATSANGDATHVNEAPRKRALLVGVSKYERHRRQPPDWWNLKCAPDVKALKELLMERFAFADSDILVLTDEAATREGIVNAFDAHLIVGAKPGDIAYFHFSGHGQKVDDDNGDEFDGMDESFVPFDYRTQSAADGAQTNLRDDQLGELLGRLQDSMSVDDKLVGNITVTLDSCFSGTATRGDPPEGRLTRRGRGWIPSIDGPEPKGTNRGAVEDRGGLLTVGEAESQGYVLITASSPYQPALQWTDSEWGEMGALTCFLVREVMAEPGATYRSLFEKLDSKLRSALSNQNPQLEGAADVALFSGTAVPREPYWLVQRVDEDEVTLPAGDVHFIRTGSTFDIYSAGADVKDPSKKIAEAVVTETRGATCTAMLTEPFRDKVDAQALQAARAVETQRSYGTEERLRVLVSGPVSDEIAAEVKQHNMVVIEGVTEDNFDVRIRRHPEKDGILVLERNAAVFSEFNPASPNAARTLHDLLANEWRSRFLMRLANPDENSLVQVDFRVVPAEVKLDSAGRLRSATRRAGVKDEEGRSLVTVKAGDYLMLEVRNRSVQYPVHITVLHFPSDSSVYCLFPEDKDENNKFEPIPNAWVSLGPRYVLQAEALDGNDGENKSAVETFKLIATREPSRYNELLPTRKARRRDAQSVRRGIASNSTRGVTAGQQASSYNLARLLGTATLGEDPEPTNTTRSALMPVAITDWNTRAVKVETRPSE